MKIILSGDEILPALEKYRAMHDPDNSLSIAEIISNPDTNQNFIGPLLHCIATIMFIGNGVDAEAIDDWLEYTFVADTFADNISDINVLGESCDILLILK